MILVIDNYDSFTYNLVHYLNELGAETVVRRNDALTVQEALGMGAEAVLLSPGPCAPDQAGICLPLLRGAPEGLAILGVCLGHQAIGQAYGGDVVRAKPSCTARPARSTTRQGHLQGPAQPLHRHPLPLAGRQPRHPAARAGGDRLDRGRRDHGLPAPHPSRLRRAVPPGIDRHRGRPPAAGQLPRPGGRQAPGRSLVL
jgi:hypothetical protein